mgnify:FL=1
MKIHIINGPNLNLLGKREPEIYGHQSFHEYVEELQEKYQDIEISYFQSNSEGELISELQESDDNVDGIIINAAAYTHTSIGIADAIRAIETPVVEVHISNIFQRESYRHHSYIAAYCVGSISGFGLNSYDLAIQSLI